MLNVSGLYPDRPAGTWMEDTINMIGWSYNNEDQSECVELLELDCSTERRRKKHIFGRFKL